MTLSPFSTGCSLSSHLGPSHSLSLLFSFLPSILLRLRHPQRLPLPSRAGTAQRPGLDVWTCLRNGALQHGWAERWLPATLPSLGRRAQPLWLVTWAFWGFVLSLSFAWSFGLVPAHTQRVTVDFWERTTFQLSPFTYCSKDVAGACYHGAVAPAQLSAANLCIWQSVLARRRMSI